jgi:hypothetical protein
VFPNRFIHQRACVAIFCCLAGLVGCGAGNAQDHKNPIYIHRVGVGNVEGLKLNIAASIEACRVAKKLPDAPKVLPPDGYLSKLVLWEDEEYFDGGRWAGYGVQRSVLADPSTNDCKLMLFVSRGVTIEQTCESKVSASMPSTMEMADPFDPKPQLAKINNNASPSPCTKKKKPWVVDGLPTHNSGNGTLCVWAADVMAATAQKAGIKAEGHNEITQDFCLYAKQPQYLWRGHQRFVTLQTSGSNRSLAGKDTSEIRGEDRAISNQWLQAFSDGTPISANRFTIEGARAFMEQPAKIGLGDMR